MSTNQVPELLTRGVETVLPSVAGLADLVQQRSIRVYLGIDPTGNNLHLGHSVVLRKLQQFVDAGHEVTLLIGNGTVKIGDPTGKDKTRPMLTDEQIEAHFQTWQAQASKILDFDRITLVHNGDWFDAMSFGELIQLFSQMTVQQLLERDMFQERMSAGRPIHAHELLYPILQGYDSVVLDVDLEIGGNDQIFNMMVGRQMQQQMNNREKFVLAVPLLVGTNGRKMGKSEGNFIGLTEPANDMYGKLMSIVDDVIVQYFELLTDVPAEEVVEIRTAIAHGDNPMPFKKRLAFTVTAMYHDEAAAQAAQDHFEKTVQNSEVPEDIPELSVAGQEITVLELVMQTGSQASRSEARRLIAQGAVYLDDVRLDDQLATVTPMAQQVLRVGKRQWWRVVA